MLQRKKVKYRNFGFFLSYVEELTFLIIICTWKDKDIKLVIFMLGALA